MKNIFFFLSVVLLQIVSAQTSIVEPPLFAFEALRWKEPLASVKQKLAPKPLIEITAADNPFEKKGEPMFHRSCRDTLGEEPAVIGFGFTKRDSLLSTVNVAFTGLSDDDESEKRIERLVTANSDRFGAPARDQKIPFVGRILLWKAGTTTIQMQVVSTSVMMIYSR